MTDSLPCPPSPCRVPLLSFSPLPPLHPGSLDHHVGLQDTGIANADSLAGARDCRTSLRAAQSASHGSLSQTLGNALSNLRNSSPRNSTASEKNGVLFEATGNSASCSDPRSRFRQVLIAENDIDEQSRSLASDSDSSPGNIIPEQPCSLERKLHRRLQRRRSFSTDLDRDAAWERKKELYQMGCEAKSSALSLPGTSASNACDTERKTWPCPPVKSLTRTRTWSLTDQDLEELRGSIDLGFGFRDDDDYDLKSTLPALELYYAINRQYADANTQSASVSPVDRISPRRSCSAESPRDSSRETLRICRPGDNPSQVKTRLRHWAQAVACSIKQGEGF